MTIKELASFTARTERTVRRWINKAQITSDTLTAKMSDAMKTNIPGDYNLDETEQILRCSSLPKIVVDDLMSNARGNIKSKDTTPLNISMEEITKMISIAVAAAMVPVMQKTVEVMNNFSNIKNNQLSLPESPDLNPRDYLNQLVREYSALKEISFKKVWSLLYTEILYRCKTNIKVRAKNEGIKPIDMLENENLLLIACSIMKSLSSN